VALCRELVGSNIQDCIYASRKAAYFMRSQGLLRPVDVERMAWGSDVETQ